MNVINFCTRKTGVALILLSTAIFSGCATRPKIDWNARIDHYTFDQAVTELGPPDKQAKLGDGTLVAEWMTQRGYWHGSPGYPYRYSPWSSGPMYPDYIQTYSPDYFLRLTFGPDGQLKSWKKFAR
jgi:hypothetical protein